MSYLGYVVAAYSVFLLVLAIDALGSWLRQRWAVQAARRHRQRQAVRSAPAPAMAELDR